MIRREVDWRSPIAAFAPLAGRKGAVLLHSGGSAQGARWSFIATSPVAVVETRAGRTFLDGNVASTSPFEALARLHDRRRRRSDRGSELSLRSGLIGFAGYECARSVEPSVRMRVSPYGLPDFWFGAYDAIASFDRVERRAFVAGRDEESVGLLRSELGAVGDAPLPQPQMTALRPGNFSSEDYQSAVADVIERIRSGDVFQANISQRLVATSTNGASAFSLFAAASAESSASFGAYFMIDGSALVSMSPERFFSVAEDGNGDWEIVAEPIKGTRPRGVDARDDARLLAELVGDPKDRAENVMIADLTRNDLSRICADHSIRELAICEPVTHATVHHLVSRIAGTLRPGATAATALAAMFPCGSVTGAPKVEAMNVIAAVEGSGRGPYCGAIGYVDDGGAADFSVAIRIAIVEKGEVTAPVGGGVTLRSDPEAEYAETIAKARWLSPFAGASGGSRR